MLYMFLLCYDPAAKRDPSDPPTLQPEDAKLEAELRQKGAYMSGAALFPGSLRVRNGQTVRSDGPFAETKEAVGGYYIIDCKDDDEVAACAARIPVGSRGWVEARRVALFHPDVEKIAALAEA